MRACPKLKFPVANYKDRGPLAHPDYQAPHIYLVDQRREGERERERKENIRREWVTKKASDKETEREVDREKRRKRERSVRFAQILYANHKISTPWHPVAPKSRDGPCWGTGALAVIHHNDNWISNCNNSTYEQKTQFNYSLSLDLTTSPMRCIRPCRKCEILSHCFSQYRCELDQNTLSFSHSHFPYHSYGRPSYHHYFADRPSNVCWMLRSQVAYGGC